MVFNITELISSHILHLNSSFFSAQGYSGWKKKYSRAQSFSSLLNLILIYSLMMIQRIAAGLCFIFYIFQNVVGPERSWRRSSQILYHRREEGGRKSYRRVEWSGVTLSYARGQLGKTRVRLLLYNMPSHHQHEWNTRLNLSIWNDAVYFCLTEWAGLGRDGLKSLIRAVNFKQSKNIIYVGASAKNGVLIMVSFQVYYLAGRLWTELSSYSNGAPDHDSDVILMFSVRSFFLSSP